MKKLLIALLTFAAIGIICSYIFIPGRIRIASNTTIQANYEGVFRVLSDTNSWEKWWPGEKSEGADGKAILSCNEINFKLNKFLYNQVELNIEEKTFLTTGSLKLFSMSIDSSLYEMDAEINTSLNPFSRIAIYLKARKIKTAFNKILQALNTYAANPKNIYGLDVKKEKVQYSYLLFTKKELDNYPTTQQVYSIVDQLRAHIVKSGGKELFHPMLNIKKIDSSLYEAQVGMPTDIKLPDSEEFFTKWMMKEGNILSAEVTGGKQQIDDAFKNFDIYIIEHKRTVIANPFQMLITDRTKEPDSTKWITRLYYPVV